MRFEGSLVKWNAERGFGFMASDQGGQDLFVHVSAFARDGMQPVVGERFSFEIALDQDGRKRAVSVRRPTVAKQGHRPRALSRLPRHDRSPATRFVAMLLLLALGAFSWSKYAHRVESYGPVSPAPSVRSVPAVQSAPSAEFLLAPSVASQTSDSHCDGRTHCSQMSSCTEAKFFLKNCPGTQMDGDHDGVPCEQQWCTSPFAR
jgi:cold shock CspA family protein